MGISKIININALASHTPRKDYIGDIEYLIIPSIFLQESVMNNIYYSPETVSKNAKSWNGTVICVNHPKKDDIAISANQIEQEAISNIGKLFNVNFDSEKKQLKGDIYIDIAKAQRLGFQDIINNFLAKKQMELSTGLYGDFDAKKGEFKGKEYQYEISNIVPDHLALLTSDLGACTIADGCGALRTNISINHNKEVHMSDLKQLITNCSCNFSEQEKQQLEALPQDLIAKLVPNKSADLKHQIEALEATISTLQANQMSQEELAYLQSLREDEELRINELRKNIVANFEHITFEIAENMNKETLNALSKHIKPLIDNSLKNGAFGQPKVVRKEFFNLKQGGLNG